MSFVASTTQAHTSSYTLPYTFDLDKWYIISGVQRQTTDVLTFLSGFTSYGAIYGYNETSYSSYGNRVWFGKATSSTVTVSITGNNTIIMIGELNPS